MPDIAFVNGTFCPASEAVISIDDRGFQFADSVYEVVVAFDGKPFGMDAHLTRLRQSLKLTDMSLDDLPYDLNAVIADGLAQCAYPEAMVYLQITRGVQPRSHVVSGPVPLTLVATFRPKPVIEADKRRSGLSVVTVEDPRWAHCEIKTTALLPNVLAKNRARNDGFDDAIFVTTSGEIREATSANVFFVRNHTLVTPAATRSILHGVTRRYILQCARSINIPVEERSVNIDDLASAEEAFLSSTTLDVMPVTSVNSKPIADGNPGPVTLKLYDTFVDLLNRERTPAK